MAARRYVASAFYLLSGIAAILLGAFAVAYPLIPWPRVFNVASRLAIKEASPATAAVVVCLALNLPLDVVQRVQMGYQEGYASNLWRAAGSLFGLAGVLLVIYLRGGLTWLVLAISGGPVLAVLLNWVSEFCWSKRWLFPNWNCYDARAARKIVGTGFLFVILQLAGALAFASDNIVAAQVLGPEAVTQYAIPARMFYAVAMVAGLLFLPLWPAYGEALARGDIVWIRRTLIRSLQITLLLVGLPSFCLVIAGKAIVHVWVGPQIQPSFLLLLGLGSFTVLTCLGSALSMFLNGTNLLKFQVICASFMAAGALVLKIWLAGRIGVAGVIWGTTISYIAFSCLTMLFYVPGVLKRMESSGRQAGV